MKEEIIESLKKSIKEYTRKEFGFDDFEPEFEIPNDPSHGDLSTNVAMKLAGRVGKNPREMAQALSSQLSAISKDFIDQVEVAGPGFVNFKFKQASFKNVIHEILKKRETFGESEMAKGKSILIEHTSPNPTKAYHLGHLKNTVTGLSVSYLHEAVGYKVIRDCIDNNRGISVARVMWGYLKFARRDKKEDFTDINYWFDHKEEWLTPQEINIDSGMFVDGLYFKASEDFKNPEVEEKVRQLVVDWEAEDPKNWELWKLTQKWVWEGYEKVLKRINAWKFDKIWHEHELYKKGKEHVYRGVEEGIFKKLEDGAVLTDLKKDFNLPDTILIKKDGTSLYITQDLELSYLKRETFKVDEMMWCIGPEQSLAMKQMFAACSQLGFGKYEDYHHLAYGFILVKGKSGNPEKMSSRAGNVVYVNQLIDRAKEDIKKYIKNTKISAEEIEEISEKVAIGAIKYGLLKVNRLQDMVFDYEETIALEGNSGPYIMYTYARAKSVLGQAESKLTDFDNLVFNNEQEIEVLKKLGEFSDTVKDAATSYAPNRVATYIYELSQIFNRFYNTLSILNAETEAEKISRLALTEATSIVLKNGLNLLGIETVEKM
jgi:arginyl-tRNA synthetase